MHIKDNVNAVLGAGPMDCSFSVRKISPPKNTIGTNNSAGIKAQETPVGLININLPSIWKVIFAEGERKNTQVTEDIKKTQIAFPQKNGLSPEFEDCLFIPIALSIAK